MKPDKQKSMPMRHGRGDWHLNQLHVDRSFPYPLHPRKARAGAVGSHWQDLPPSTGINWRRKAGTRRIRGLAPASGHVHPNDPLRSRLAATLRMRLVTMISSSRNMESEENMTISPHFTQRHPYIQINCSLQPTKPVSTSAPEGRSWGRGPPNKTDFQGWKPHLQDRF